ncbi:phytoene desaturase family protein [Aspergillus affinis]|uniref:phytoene desaturase family protein n=1 Tax=Aspergillus affinis TaxID=1070780 RepID=UPI0022FEB63A|nr:phytoene dehydrogenase [Aspergillus affinis]KAI9038984.1 phytoene dehydrogenase [Aspergillus affinis]
MAGPSVIVIGAGAGGLAAAARLAQQGAKVKVIEKNDCVGGRCSIIHDNGFRFDQGPSLVLMPEIFLETFQDLGTSMNEEGLDMLKCEPNYRIWFADGDTVELSSNLSQLKQEIQRHEGPDSFPRLCAFLSEAGTYYDLALNYVLRRNFPSILSLLQPRVLLGLLRMRPWTTVYGRASQYFYSDKMRRAWTFASMYLGMSPYVAPGTYALLQYTETVDGIWYPRGGFQAILQALADVGSRFGVQYRLNSTVESIIVSKDHPKSAQGVRLSSGDELYADIVLANADLVYVYNELLPPSPQACALKRRQASCSSVSFFWAMDRTLPQLNAHNIFLAHKYQESFDAIFKHHSIPNEPSFYVNVPSRVDPTAAPAGKETMVVLVPVGNLTSASVDETQTWEQKIPAIRNFVLEALKMRAGLGDLSSDILSERYETPATWQSKFNLDRGAILGLSHSFLNVLSFRPKTKHPDIENLYFVGASTHPGTGVPICLAGGKLVAQQILENYDKAEEGWSSSSFQIIMALVAVLVVTISLLANNLSSNGLFVYLPEH